MNNSLVSALAIATEYLTNFANSNNFWQDFELAFGHNYDRKIALNIKNSLSNTTFTPPKLLLSIDKY
jgi:hypothetical protein